MTTIHFHRIADFASHRGIVVRGVDAFFDLCRHLTDRGWRGPVEGIDERGVRCWEADDIAAVARRYRPNEADRAAKAEQDRLARQKKLLEAANV